MYKYTGLLKKLQTNNLFTPYLFTSKFNNLMTRKLITIQLLMCLFLMNAKGQSPITAKLLLGGGIEFGGDDVIEVLFTTGETQSIRAGQGGFVEVGGQFQFSGLEKLLIRASVRFKYTTTAAENANIRFTRIPLVLAGHWMLNKDFRIGVGLAAHQSIRLKGNGFLDDTDFEGTIGPKFEIGYRWIGLTYTLMNYVDEFDNEYNANSIGVSLSFTLPNK